MGAGISPMGMNMPQQPQGQGKGGGGRSAFNQQQLMGVPGFSDSLQATQQRMAQDPNANMMRTQPAQAQGPMSIDEFARSPLMGATTMEMRNPVEFEGSMRDPELVRRYEQYRSGQPQQPMNQLGDMRFMQPSQTPIQAQLAVDAQRRANPFNQQMQAQADALQGRRQAPQMNDQMRMEQMRNDQIRMQQMMQQRQMPFQMQPQMNNPMFGGLGALMAMRGFGGGGFGQPMGGFGGGFGGGYAPPQFGGGFGGKGGGGFSQPQMGSPFSAAMGRGLGGLSRFFR